MAASSADTTAKVVDAELATDIAETKIKLERIETEIDTL
jgi:hypothetical protein